MALFGLPLPATLPNLIVMFLRVPRTAAHRLHAVHVQQLRRWLCPSTPGHGSTSRASRTRCKYHATLNTTRRAPLDVPYILTTDRTVWVSEDLVRNAQAADVGMLVAVDRQIAWRAAMFWGNVHGYLTHMRNITSASGARLDVLYILKTERSTWLARRGGEQEFGVRRGGGRRGDGGGYGRHAEGGDVSGEYSWTTNIHHAGGTPP
ncbi:hypothetical protein B0H17DRAFT_1133011 [Mycena rosella]|uniref:Uncharacterized protein n=1 Tax=Mycena rosella TaxID=1033263 RepID=A0AAD7GFP6_MYCRO|nr:hypothetical protein B0H17DRAFT_1133011 [Mycena rosella]